MKIYTALLRHDAEPVLVKEGFSWGAFLFGPFWLLAHRAWTAAALSFVAYLLIALLTAPALGPILGTGVAVILGLTGSDLRRWALEQRGYMLLHVLAARGWDEAWQRLLTYRPDLMERLRPGVV